jgi:hypothetical protein
LGSTDLEAGTTDRRPGPPRQIDGPILSVLDEAYVLAALNATFQFHMITADNESKNLLYWALRPLVPAFNGLWSVLWGAIDAFTKLGLLTGDTFLKYWSLVLSPIWSKLWAALVDFYDLAREVTGHAIKGVDFLSRYVVGPFFTWVNSLLVAVTGIPAQLRLARNVVGVAAQAGELLVAVVEAKVRGAFGAFVGAYNEAADWLNHLVQEDGYFRPLTFVWSLWTWASDVWTTLGNALLSDDADARWQSVVARWVIRPLPVVLAEFAAGPVRNQAAVDAALARFRAGSF